MTALSAEESVELQHEAAGQVGQLNTKHKAEVLALQASYNEAVDKLKGEMLGLIEERASTAATATIIIRWRIGTTTSSISV